MTEAVHHILESALQLSTSERAELMGHLAASLPGEDCLDEMKPVSWMLGKPEFADAGRSRRGDVEPIDGETVFRELYARLGHEVPVPASRWRRV